MNTLKHRNNLKKLYSDKVSKARQKLTYQKVKRLDQLAKKEHTSFIVQLNKDIIKQRRRQVSYIANKYEVSKEDANKILRNAIKNGTSYKEEYEKLSKFEDNINWFALVDALRSSEFKEVVFTLHGTINGGEQIDYDLKTNGENFGIFVPEIRNLLENNIPDDPSSYVVFAKYFVIHFNNIIPADANKVRITFDKKTVLL